MGRVALHTSETLEHLPFFERLGKLPEDTADWRRTRGGLLVLRLIDSLYADPTPNDRWNLRAIRTAISEVEPTDHLQSMLNGILDTVARAEGNVPGGLLPRMMAFGRALDFTAEWELAADVYRTVLRHAHPEYEGEIAIDACMRLGYCGRMQGRWDAAMEAYMQAGRLADALGDRQRRLRVWHQKATVVRLRGNLPLAERLLEETIPMCDRVEDTSLLAPMLHERAVVAFLRKEFAKGLDYANRSIELEQEPAQRDRVLTDMASAFLGLGIRSAARDAYLLVAATAQEQWTRWLAMVNLMELASLDGLGAVFLSYRLELADAPLPPQLRGAFLLNEGRGLHLFGEAEAGNSALRRAVVFAEANSLNNVIFSAEAMLRNPPGPYAQAEVEPRMISEKLLEVASNLRRKREKAGV